MTSRDYIVRRRPYVLPRPCESESEYARFFHLDVAGMTPLERWAEHRAAGDALVDLVREGRDPIIVYGVGATLGGGEWLRERIARTRGSLS